MAWVVGLKRDIGVKKGQQKKPLPTGKSRGDEGSPTKKLNSVFTRKKDRDRHGNGGAASSTNRQRNTRSATKRLPFQ